MEELLIISKEILMQLKSCEDEKNNSSDKVISDEYLSVLNCIFPTLLEGALDLIDNSSVTRIECPKGRSIYKVNGSMGTVYTVMGSSLYCTCPTFYYSCVKKRSHAICKHLLAVYLAYATGTLKHTTLSNKDYALTLLDN
ncbi:zinc finger SWIM domain-containing protein 7 [Hydra vulgaris]|uniref:Zinc finger SWIM domain-containing protein 7 n=1 Tax=Hydra vulgaris TaxID=6087 RepID=A0ABM4C6J3_HYDVU